MPLPARGGSGTVEPGTPQDLIHRIHLNFHFRFPPLQQDIDRRLGLDEALILASAYAVLGHGSAALAALDRFAPPEGTPERAAFTRVRDRLAEDVRANLDVQGVGQRR